MTVLYLSQYFPPEAGATQTRSYEIARTFVRLGHQVTMICEFPNHPSGILWPNYRKRLYETTELDGIRVIRVPVWVSNTKNFRTRMLFYTSFMLSAIAAGVLLARGNFDLIYATSPPLFSGAAGLVLSKWKRSPLVFEVRDLWPESAIALGELNRAELIRWAYRLEQSCYNRARQVVVVTTGIRNNLIGRGIPNEKIIVIPNGASLDSLRYDEAGRNSIRASYGLSDRFVVLYAGIFGIAQGLEMVIEAARLLISHPQFHFLMVGAGPRKPDIEALVAEYKSTNVTILPEVPINQMSGYLSAADISLVPLQDKQVFRNAIPSKIFDAWACQRPVIHTVDGEARELVDQAGGGFFIPPQNPQALAEKLISLLDQKPKLLKMGSSGFDYAKNHYSRRILSEQLIKILEKEFDQEL